MPRIERPDRKRPKKEHPGEDALVTLWRRRLKLSEDKLKEKGGDIKQGDWRDLIRFFEGDQWRPDKKSEQKFHRVTANQAKSNIDAIRPQLYFQNPRVRIQIKNPSLAEVDIPEVDPATGQPVLQPGPMGPVPVIRIPRGTPVAQIGGQQVNAQEQVDLLESIDNYYLEEMGAKATIRRVLNDALVLPYGVCRLEWVVEMEKVEGEGGRVTEKVTAQYPRLERVKPWCFLWDSELDEFNLDRAKWVAEIKLLSRAEIDADELLKVDWDEVDSPGYYIDDEYAGDDPSRVPEDVKRYKLYEIHDLEREAFMVWLEGSPKLNRLDEPSHYKAVEGSIYTVLGFDETIDDSFPLSIPAQIKSEAEAYNYLLSYQTNHAARFNRKYKIVTGTMRPEEKEKLELGADGTIIEVESQNTGPDPIADAQISPDVYNVGSILKREITEKIGVTAYGRGTRETGVDTAFEANLIQGGADVKVQEKRDTVREFLKKVVRKLNQILKSYADTATVTQIVGPKGNRWVKWTNQDIQGEFLEDVDIYNSLPYAKETEKKQWMELLSLANGNPFVNQRRLWMKVFRAFDESEELLNTPQEQQEMMMQQQQMQAMEEQKKQQSRTIRPSEGQTKRAPDMMAGIMGEARRI